MDKRKVIRATQGYVLTDMERTMFLQEISLGENDSPDNYQEISVEETEKIKDKTLESFSDTGI